MIGVGHLTALLGAAWTDVRVRDTAPGTDRQTVAQFAAASAHELEKLWEQLHSGSYQPTPGRRVVIAADHERPIVIASVRDRVVQHPCECAFANLHARTYPTPLLHGVHPREIAVIHKNTSPVSGPPSSTMSGPKGLSPPPHATGTADPRRAAVHTDAAHTHGQESTIATRPSKPAALPQPPPARVTPSPGPTMTSDSGGRAAAAVQQLQELRQHLSGIERSIRRQEDELDAIFDALGVDRLVTPKGVLIRVDRRASRFAWEI